MEIACERVNSQGQIVWRAVISSQRSCSITSPCRPQLGAWEKEDWGLNPRGFEADRVAGEKVPGEPRIIWAYLCFGFCFVFQELMENVKETGQRDSLQTYSHSNVHSAVICFLTKERQRKKFTRGHSTQTGLLASFFLAVFTKNKNGIHHCPFSSQSLNH